MKESDRQKSLKIQKLIVASCALMAVVPVAFLVKGIYQKDTVTIKKGLLGSFFGGSGVCLACIGYALSPDRKNRD